MTAIELSAVPEKINDKISSVLSKQTPKPRGRPAKPKLKATKPRAPKAKARATTVKKVKDVISESIKESLKESARGSSMSSMASSMASSISSTTSKISRGANVSFIEINTGKMWAIVCLALSCLFAYYAIKCMCNASSKMKSSNPHIGKLLAPTPEEYAELQKKPLFTLYWSKNCPHCHTLLKLLQPACNILKNTPCAAIEASEFEDQFRKNKVEYIPYFVFEKDGQKVEFEGERDENGIKKFLEQHDN